MTNGLIVVEWADLTGTGFSRQRHGTDAPERYWSAAEALLAADLSQPPAKILDTGRHPIWTLRRVPVGERKTWCFVVQGRQGEGDFGVAGTCRFAFAVEDLDAREVWQRGLRAAGFRPAEPQMSDDRLAAEVRQVLLGVVGRQSRIPVRLAPADTERVIRCVLDALPEPELRRWSWSTCALLPPARGRRGLISGSWPEEFRAWEPDMGRAVARSFDVSPATTQEIGRGLGAAMTAGFEELVQQAVVGTVEPELLRSCTTVEEVIGRIGQYSKPVGLDAVAAMLNAPKGPEKLFEHHPKLLVAWAGERPEEAAGCLRTVTHEGALGRILRGLVPAQRGTRTNLLGLPTAGSPGPDPWHDRLARGLRAAYRRQAELHKAVTAWTEDPGVWADPGDAAAGRDFLRGLGLDEHRCPDLYRAQPGVVVDQINDERRITEIAQAELGLGPEPLLLIEELSGQLDPLPAVEAADLIRGRYGKTSPKRAMTAIENIAFELTSTRMGEGTAEEWEIWIGEFTAGVEPDYQMAGQVLAGGLDALCRADPEAPHEALLAVCRRVAERTELPAMTRARIEASEQRLRPAVARASVPQGSYHPPVEALPETPPSRRWDLPWLRIAMGVSAVTPVVAVVVLVLQQTLPAEPGPASSTVPAVPTRPVAEAPALPPAPRTITLPPPFSPRPDQQADADERDFFRQFADDRVGRQIDLLVFLSDQRGQPYRADRLRDRVRQDVRLQDVRVKSVSGLDPDQPAAAGSLQVIIVYGGR